MVSITQRVISNRLTMSLPSESTIAFNRSLLKLYFKFLKKERIFGGVYGKENPNLPTFNKIMKYAYPLSVSPFSNSYTYVVIGGTQKDGLVYSQLWRGYVLDNIGSLEFTNDSHRENVLYNLKSDLRINGSRGDERVREILKKNELKIIETKNE